MSLRVLHPGAYSLLVDAGRPHYRHRGVALGGAADCAAWMIGNALVGNAPDAPALEIALSGPTLQAEADVGVCLFGAPFIMRRDIGPIAAASTFTLRAGETLTIGGSPSGARAYLCVAGGGFISARVLDSCTSLTRCKLGDVLQCPSRRIAARSVEALSARALLEVADPVGTLRAIVGAQADWFDQPLHGLRFQVTPASNRMGIRLEGPVLKRLPGELVSEAVAPGAVQVTNEGQCIILGVDGQTIGGYPKIAHIIAADLDRLAQLRPGDAVRFQLIDVATAESLHAKFRARVRQTLRRIQLAEWIG